MKKSVLTVFAEISAATIFALSLSSCGTTNSADTQVTAETVKTAIAETAAKITEADTEATTATSAETEAETTETETEATTEETAAAAETEKICICDNKFQHACCEYLNNLDSLAGGIYFDDINGDDTPEAIVEKNPFELTYVLYENENDMQVLKLPTEADLGHVRYIADTKQILFNPRRDSSWKSWGCEEYHIYSWNGTDYEETSTVYREPGIRGVRDGVEYSELGQAYIDGEVVDNDTFDIKLAEMQKLINENSYFPVVSLLDENFESYLFEKFPCFDNWDCFPVKEDNL